MREILRVAGRRDADVVGWLEVIDQFDHAVAANASLEELVRLSGDITGFAVGVWDERSAVHVEAADASSTPRAASGEVVAAAIDRGRLDGRHALEVITPHGHALVAQIYPATRQVGVAWLLSPADRAWAPADFLVVERLARATAARALGLSEQRSRTAFDPAAVERLLCGGLSDAELVQASWHAKLSLSDRYVAIALDQSPPGTVELETLAALAENVIAGQGLAARRAVIGRVAAVVTRSGEALAPALDVLADGEDRHGFAIHLGVGDATDLPKLPTSWRRAQEALALRRLLGAGNAPAYFSQLGILHLLAQVPIEQIQKSELPQRMSQSLTTSSSPSDLEVLEAYLEEGTLRLAGKRVFLHHTTVQHRLKGIEERLGVNLRDVGVHFQLLLTLKLLSIVHAKGPAHR